eukprot:SAG11_NODE_2117_length_3792_cov_2.955321_1_plen_198_part_00
MLAAVRIAPDRERWTRHASISFGRGRMGTFQSALALTLLLPPLHQRASMPSAFLLCTSSPMQKPRGDLGTKFGLCGCYMVQVGQAAAADPAKTARLVVLEWQGAGEEAQGRPILGLVGKGVTFDTARSLWPTFPSAFSAWSSSHSPEFSGPPLRALNCCTPQGGLNLKPTGAIEQMHLDMAGVRTNDTSALVCLPPV